ncbi:MAG: hypothetical protein CVU18_12365 [Betaproteobacteria bacterium HGW-Betaproteobacteria-12]|nr:MAG: hypothetical protein CVU18_12365 [Betaproteobacteria bacterium HGW-Betaproteobacteria-12]
MSKTKSAVAFAASLAASAALISAPIPAAVAAEASGSDFAFNEMLLDMSGQDTGSQWFNYYVETVNQEIAYKDTVEPYGAAGPSGAIAGFDGYLSGFIAPDTGSQWFNMYVDGVKRTLQTYEQTAAE